MLRILALAALSLPAAAQTNLIVDPSFEGPQPACGPPPGTPGVWGGDYFLWVGPENGVIPRSGSQMHRFLGNGWCSYTGGSASQAHQWIDISNWAAEVDTGRARLRARGWFNRADFVPDSHDFALSLFAYGEGAPPASFASDWKYRNSLVVDLDADPSTWELVECSVCLPPGTRSVFTQGSTSGATVYWGHYLDDFDADLIFDDACTAFLTDISSISLKSGGAQVLSLDAPQVFADHIYLVLGSVSGTTSAVPLPELNPISSWLLLTPDPYYDLTLSNTTATPLQPGLGLLDGEGMATVEFVVPPGTSASLAGTTVYHAALLIDPATLVPEVTTYTRQVELVP